MAKRSSNSLANLSIDEIQRELRRRQRSLPALQRRRSALLTKVAAIDAQIAKLGGATAGAPGRIAGLAGRKGGGRRPAGTALIDVLHKLLQGKTMGVEEAGEAARKAGYESDSPNYRVMVNAALLKKSHFKRIARGKYTSI